MFKSETKPVQGTTTTAQEKGEQQELNIHYSQKSLAYFPTYATYCTYYLTEYNLNAHKLWQGLANTIDAYSAKTDYKTTVILGVGFELWTSWSSQLGYTLPKGMETKINLLSMVKYLEILEEIFGFILNQMMNRLPKKYLKL